jgi:hypothetical protein
LVFLNNAFREARSGDLVYLRHASNSTKLIFRKDLDPFGLLFCRPSPELSKKLAKIRNGFYLPDNISAKEAIELINQQAKEKF